jgi:hypothetical protein
MVRGKRRDPDETSGSLFLAFTHKIIIPKGGKGERAERARSDPGIAVILSLSLRTASALPPPAYAGYAGYAMMD